MLILITVFILFAVPAVMFIVNLFNPKFAFHWIIALLAAMISFILTLFSKPEQSSLIWSANWQPASLFTDSPKFLLDTISWTLSLALVTILLTVLLTATTRQPVGTWRTWSGNLIITGLGLLSVLAGNPLALLLCWAAIDFFESLLLISMIRASATRQKIIIVISARVIGIFMLILASILARLSGGPLGFESIPENVNLLLLMAAGLRLGVLPLHPPFLKDRPIRGTLGMSLRFTPAAASFMLLVRSAGFSVPITAQPWLLILLGVAGLYSALSWFNSQSALSGRPYWILGTSTLAVAAAVHVQSLASLAWSLTCLLFGCLLFLYAHRSSFLTPVIYLGLLGLTALPMTPTWVGLGTYSLWNGDPINLFNILLDLVFGFTHIVLIIGAFRHLNRPVEITVPLERWTWFFYAPGLVLLLLVYAYVGWIIRPGTVLASLQGWSGGFIVTVIVFIGLMIYRNPRLKPVQLRAKNVASFWTTFGERLLSLEWVYSIALGGYHFLSRIIGWFTIILEGEGGILWALVFLILLYTISQQIGLTAK